MLVLGWPVVSSCPVTVTPATPLAQPVVVTCAGLAQKTVDGPTVPLSARPAGSGVSPFMVMVSFEMPAAVIDNGRVDVATNPEPGSAKAVITTCWPIGAASVKEPDESGAAFEQSLPETAMQS